MEEASPVPDSNGQQQNAQERDEEAELRSPVASSPTAQQRLRRYKYDAGDAVILHGLIRSTHVNGRRGVVHYATDTALPGGGGGGNANANNNTDNNNNNTDNNDDDERRCMIRLLPLERSNNDNEPDGAGANSVNGNSRGRGGQHCISVKAKNMTLDYPPGQRVLLQGLVMAKHLNGRVAKIIRFRKGKRTSRFLVEVPVHRGDDEKKAANEEDRNTPLTAKGNSVVSEDLNAQFVFDAMSRRSAEEGTAKQQCMDDSSLRSAFAENVKRAGSEKKVKQILVSPKNIIHLPGTKPPLVPSLDQRLIFAGTMAAITKLLNQSVHKALTPHDVMEGNGFGLLSEYPSEEDELRYNSPEGVAQTASSARLWGKIQQRSYGLRPDDDDSEDTHEDRRRAPPFYQRLVPTSPQFGRANRACFNPKCRALVPLSAERCRRMKRCTRCRSVAYCDRKCAAEAWEHHRGVCRVMRADGVHFADCVSLTSPRREEVIEAQRTLRLCVNRIAGSGDPAGHFERMRGEGRDDDNDDKGGGRESRNDAATAKLLYDAITQGGTDVANEILLHLENPPPVGGEVTVAVGFNSLGHDPVFSELDIQLFANIYGCTVTYRVLRKSVDDDGTEVGVPEDIVRGPNGEEIPMPGHEVPGDVQEGFLNFLNNLMPGAMPPGANNGNGDPPGPGPGVDGDGAAREEGGGDAADNNNGAAAALGMPPEVANFLNHVMNEAGVGVQLGNDNNGGDVDDGNAAAAADEDEGAPDENHPPLEDVADAAEENADAGQPPREQQRGDGGFHFDFPGGGAHVHMAHLNGNNGQEGLPPGVPMPPPGAFFQVPGMPVGVQVAVAQGGPEDFPGGDNGGIMGGMMGEMPPPGAFLPIPGVPGGFHAMHAGPLPGGDGTMAAAMMGAGVFGAPPLGVGDGNAGSEAAGEEDEMEIED